MKLHFIGIKGVSMGFLASLCEKEGHVVTGSDTSLSGHKAENVHGADAVVYSYAIAPDNPELCEAKRLGLPLLSRAELLGTISRGYDKVIAVSGTHGKTTTTSMLMNALADLNPTVHVGGFCKGKSGNIGGKELFVTEACEYRESFLTLEPDIAVVLNVELDHADYYKTFSAFYDAFDRFVKKSKVAFVCGDDEARFLKAKERTFTFGLGTHNDYYARDEGEQNGYHAFSAYFAGEKFAHIRLGVRGGYNITNALAALAVCHYLGKDYSGIENFTGVDRRFESLAVTDGREYISDYAHHPHEIECSLIGAKQIYGRVLAVFEPHTYSRTQAFYKQIAKSLSIADKCLLLPVYPARETPVEGVDSRLIAEQGGFECVNSYDEAAQRIARLEGDYDAVIFMGAGSIDGFARRYVREKMRARKTKDKNT